MPTLSITKTYLNGNVLAEVDLDNIKNSVTNFLNVTKLDSTNFSSAGLLGTNLANGTVSNSNLASSAITSANFASSAITMSAWGQLAVNTAHVSSTAVTNPIIGAKNSSTSQSCGAFLSSSTAFVAITNLTTSITTVGRPVWVGLIPDGTLVASGSENAIIPSTGVGLTNFQILRNSAVILNKRFGHFNGNLYTQVTDLACIDFPASSSYTYSVQGRFETPGNTSPFLVRSAALIVYEL